MRIAKTVDIRHGAQENLKAGEGHMTMEGVSLSITTAFGGFFIAILIVLSAFYWIRDVYQDIKAPVELDKPPETEDANR